MLRSHLHRTCTKTCLLASQFVQRLTTPSSKPNLSWAKVTSTKQRKKSSSSCWSMRSTPREWRLLPRAEPRKARIRADTSTRREWLRRGLSSASRTTFWSKICPPMSPKRPSIGRSSGKRLWKRSVWRIDWSRFRVSTVTASWQWPNHALKSSLTERYSQAVWFTWTCKVSPPAKSFWRSSSSWLSRGWTVAGTLSRFSTSRAWQTQRISQTLSLVSSNRHQSWGFRR